MAQRDDFNFQAEADNLLIVAGRLDACPLEDIRAAVNRAHTLGPIIDPTRYMDALRRDHIDDIAELARLAQAVTAKYRQIRQKAFEQQKQQTTTDVIVGYTPL